MSHNIRTFFDILLIIAANVIKSNDYSDFITRFVRPAEKVYFRECDNLEYVNHEKKDIRQTIGMAEVP